MQKSGFACAETLHYCKTGCSWFAVLEKFRNKNTIKPSGRSFYADSFLPGVDLCRLRYLHFYSYQTQLNFK